MSESTPAAVVDGRHRTKQIIAVVAVSVVAALVVFGVTSAISPTYESSASFRVTITNPVGINDTVTSAANDLATQYAQLVSASGVVDPAARDLGMSSSDLRSATAGSTVNGQNLVRVTASAGSGSAAKQRAAAVTRSLQSYIQRVNIEQSRTYSDVVAKNLKSVDKRIADLTGRINRANPDDRPGLNAMLTSLLSQRQGVQSDVAQTVASGQPILQGAAAASDGTKQRPRPALYALVALLVVGLVMSRIVTLTSSARPAPA